MLSEQEREELEYALLARGGPVLPLLDQAPEQAPMAPAQGADAAAAGGGAGAAPGAPAEPPPAVDGAAAYGPPQAQDPLQEAEEAAPGRAEILQPPMEAPEELPDVDEADDGGDDDYLDDLPEQADDALEHEFTNLDWWDTVPWERILLQGAPTTAMIPIAWQRQSVTSRCRFA